jgi:methyl-galactoside transport system permease protein
LAILAAVAFCLLNAFGFAVLKMHPFIISLGTQLIAYGALCLYIDSQANGAQPLASLDQRYIGAVNGSLRLGTVNIPYLVIYLAVCAAAMWVIWNKTTIGKNMFAIGGNPEAAAVSGVGVIRNIFAVYVIAGILYGIAAFLEAGRVQSVTTNTGLNYELDAISGCVIGGVSFTGGVGTIPGVLIGVIILQVINYSLYYLSVNAYYQYIIKGAIIILAVAIEVRKYIAKK